MSQAKNSTQVLKAAKWMLENVGWIQGALWRTEERKPIGFCLSGALRYVNTNEHVRQRAFDRVRVLLPNSIWAFNDNPSTTKEKVIALLDRAIKGE